MDLKSYVQALVNDAVETQVNALLETAVTEALGCDTSTAPNNNEDTQQALDLADDEDETKYSHATNGTAYLAATMLACGHTNADISKALAVLGKPMREAAVGAMNEGRSRVKMVALAKRNVANASNVFDFSAKR